MNQPDEQNNDVISGDANPTSASDRTRRGRVTITRLSDGKVVTGLKGCSLRHVPASKANALAHWKKLKTGQTKPWTLAPLFGEHGIVYRVGRHSATDTLVSTFIMLLPALEREAAAEFFRRRGIQFSLKGVVEPRRARRTKRQPKTLQAACRVIFTNLVKENPSLRGIIKTDLAGKPCVGVTVGNHFDMVPIDAFVGQLTPKQQIKARELFQKYL